MATHDWKRGLAFALLTVLMWGLLPLGLKEVLGHMDPVTITWYRFSISAAIALAWYGWRSGPALSALLSPGHRPWAVTVVLGLLCNYLFYVWGLDHLTPGAAQIIIQIAPLMLLLASVVVLGERLYPLQWLGAAAFVVGLLLFFHKRLGEDVPTGDAYLTGVLLMFGAAATWTVYGLAQKKLLVAHHAREILLLICAGCSLLLLPLSSPLQVLDLSAWELAMLLFCGVNTIVAYGAFGLALSYWDAARVSAVIPLTPLFTLLFTWLLNRWAGAGIPAEPLDWLSAFGALVVVAGAALATLPRRTAPR